MKKEHRGENWKYHKGKCAVCEEVITSEHPGHFVSCKCGKSFIDTDRWFPGRIRLGGDIEFISSTKDI